MAAEDGKEQYSMSMVDVVWIRYHIRLYTYTIDGVNYVSYKNMIIYIVKELYEIQKNYTENLCECYTSNRQLFA